jgi:hypothetical protein
MYFEVGLGGGGGLQNVGSGQGKWRIVVNTVTNRRVLQVTGHF